MITFTGKEIPSFLKVTGITFPVLGEVSVQESEIPRRIGNVDNGVKFGAKQIKISVLFVPIPNKTIHDQADLLKEWLMGDNWKVGKLVFSEQSNKYIVGRFANNIEIEDLFIAGQGELEFRASDPIKYDSQSTSKSSSSGNLVIEYTGLEKAPTVFTVQMTQGVENFTIEHVQTGKKLSLLGNFLTGQTIVIDSNKKIAKLNGQTQMKLVDLENDWLYLQKGTNTFKFKSNDNNKINDFQLTYTKAD
ncbi:phage tail family protein [Enterococcus casseliflavus]|uniref:distal tail protein Dit n=1 Tax=Enterococcus casseliflavus TaxID=37734 RepID=UPI002DB80C40|nr:distal tail protein Dit [Enterococcus casseliflavus]MEB6213504.1 phage tail family protein [Enterococcus casseliflavus]